MAPEDRDVEWLYSTTGKVLLPPKLPSMESEGTVSRRSKPTATAIGRKIVIFRTAWPRRVAKRESRDEEGEVVPPRGMARGDTMTFCLLLLGLPL